MPGGWRVVDIWESEEAFERFAQARLRPAVHRGLGFRTCPTPRFYPVEGVWVAEWDMSRILTSE